MANTCWNLFSFYGNEKVVEQVKQWQKGLDSAQPTEDDKNCMGAIRTVFYPDSKPDDELDYGSKWVHQDNEAFSPEENQLGFQSAWSSPDELQKHLTLLLYKLDPNILVENSYNIEDGSMGFTYTAVNSSGEVCIHTAHADCDYDDFDETEDAENAQQETLNEWQIDAVMDLISDVPNIEITVKANMPYLEIDWDYFKN
jgi:hypothetical protein